MNTEVSDSKKTRLAGLAWAYQTLRQTGRGKHVGKFSYYHTSLLAKAPSVEQFLTRTLLDVHGTRIEFNVVKLDRDSRLSFLLYDDFTAQFPTLRSAVSLDLALGTSRATNYSHRSNPPILHRKELLLCADDPLVPKAAQLTERLDACGAFAKSNKIGTRNGWASRLHDLGMTLIDGDVKVTGCQLQ